MGRSEMILAGTCALSAATWALLAMWRSSGGSFRGAFRALLGGAAASGMALAAYDLLHRLGLEVRWEVIVDGGWRSVAMSAAIVLVEESAKLGGIALAVRRPERPGAVMRATIGVSAAFAAIEAGVTLAGTPAPLAFARALLAPAAHAILSAPLGFGVAAFARERRRGGLLLALGFLVSAGLHGAGDLSLAAPRYGQLGYAAALLAPALWIFLHARRISPMRVAMDGPGYLTQAGRSR
jgi:RsiW-degrading membrane proteinase PrsW (M82 family)